MLQNAIDGMVQEKIGAGKVHLLTALRKKIRTLRQKWHDRR